MFKLLSSLVILNLTFNYAVGDLLNLSPDNDRIVRFVGQKLLVVCSPKGKNVQRLIWEGPDNQQIATYDDRISVGAVSSTQGSLDLVNRNIQMKDRGNYTCSATVNDKETKKVFELQVYKVAEFKGTPKEQFLEEGKNSTIKCNVNGDPKPRVSWLKGDRNVAITNVSRFQPDEDNKNWLTVLNASLEDAGEYTCRSFQLNNDVSEMRQFVITVKVHHKPIGAKKYSNESFSFVSGVVNLTCEAVAEPKANFTWLKDGVTINESETFQLFNDDHKSILEITVDDESLFGDYYCKAQNSLGTLERVVTLEKGRKPSIPSAKVMKQGHNYFELQVRSQNHPEMLILFYKVEFKRRGEDWANANVTKFPAQSSDKYILKNLEPSTLYVLRASALNVAGASDYSSEMLKKTTKPPASGVQPTTIPTFLIAFVVVLTVART